MSVPLRKGISLAVMACLGAFGSVITASAQSSAASPTAASSSDTIASGAVVNAQGRPDPNAEVYVLALPDQSDTIGQPAGKQFSFTLAGSARTNASGSYTVNASPTTLMGTNGRHGYLNLQLIAVSQGSVMQFAYSVANTGNSWRVEGGASATPSASFDFGARTVTGTPAAATVAPGSSAAPAAVAKKPAAPTASASSTVTSVTSFTPVAPTSSLQQLRQSTQFASKPPPPTPGFCIYYWGTIYYNLKEHFLNAETYGNIPVTVTEGTNSSTTATLGIGYSYTGQSGTWSASGTGSITDSATHGVSITYGSTYSVYNRVNYRDLINSCGGIWREPYSFYDLLTSDGGPVGITWQWNCGNHGAGSVWYTANATDATIGGGVSLGVLNVSAQQGYGTSIQLEYHFNVAGEICGNSTSGPLASSLLEADPY